MPSGGGVEPLGGTLFVRAGDTVYPLHLNPPHLAKSCAIPGTNVHATSYRSPR